MCSRINKYIGQNITKKDERDEWMALKKEIKNKNKNAIIGDYYDGLLLFLYGKDHEINEDYDILSQNNSATRNCVKNLINILSLFEEIYNSNVEDKLQTAIIYIVYELKGAEYISNKFKTIQKFAIQLYIKVDKEKKKNLEKDAINQKRKAIKALISGLGEN